MLTRYELSVLHVFGFALHLLWSLLSSAGDLAFVVTDHAQVASQFVVTDQSQADAGAAPTPYAEVTRVLGLLPTPQVGFADLGCGDGRWLFAAAEKWPGVRVTGVEIDPARSEATRERVREAGLEGRITVITGDVLTTAVEADVATMYLYPETLSKLVPRLKTIRSCASYMHEPVGLGAVRNGDTWIYVMPVVQQPQAAVAQHRGAVWGGQVYSGPVCNRPNCPMCASIRNQLSTPVVSAQPASGHWVKRCQNGRCWMEFVPN